MEFRCTECGWLDPKLWTNQDRCNCAHYWAISEVELFQCNLTHRICGHSWSFLTQL